MPDIQNSFRQLRVHLFLGALIVLVIIGGSFFLGRYPGPYITPPSILSEDGLALKVILQLRLPRIISAFVLGMALSASGTVFQMIFRNPLVESGLLGVSQGAAFGASLAIVLLGGRALTVQGCAALFALLGLTFSTFLALRIRMGDWVLRLVLAGIAVSALYSAGTGALKYLADPFRELPDITFWLLGGLWGITWSDLIQILPIVISCLTIIYLMRWRLNLLSMKDETAFSLTSAPGRERLILLVCAVIATAAVVSKAGQISWVGLIMPHIARRILGSDAQRVLPGAMILGGCFVLLCDNISRTLLTGEIPLGILTSFTGAGIFLILLTRNSLRLRKR